MNPSDEAQKVEPTNVQSAAASQTPRSSTATPPTIPARPNHLLTLRAESAASDEPMITVAAQAARRRRDERVVRRERRRLEREQRAAAEHDDAGEEPVRVEADDPRVQAAEKPEERERGADEERARGLRVVRPEREREHAERHVDVAEERRIGPHQAVTSVRCGARHGWTTVYKIV